MAGLIKSLRVVNITSSTVLLTRVGEPSGMTQVNVNDFAGKPGNFPAAYQGWQNRESSSDAPNAANLLVQSDSIAPKNPGDSDNGILTAQFPAGFTPGGSPIQYAYYMASGDIRPTMYVNFALKFFPGWQNDINGAGVKLLWFHSFTIGDLDGQFYMGSGSGVDNPIRFNIQGGAPVHPPNDINVGSSPLTGNRDLFGCNLDSDAANLAQYGSNWIEFGIAMEMNTNSSTADGTLDTWINVPAMGVTKQLGHITDLALRPRVDRCWTGLRWEPTFGGLGDAPTIDIFEAISAFYVSMK